MLWSVKLQRTVAALAFYTKFGEMQGMPCLEAR